jgi:hypothetical protein
MDKGERRRTAADRPTSTDSSFVISRSPVQVGVAGSKTLTKSAILDVAHIELFISRSAVQVSASAPRTRTNIDFPRRSPRRWCCGGQDVDGRDSPTRPSWSRSRSRLTLRHAQLHGSDLHARIVTWAELDPVRGILSERPDRARTPGRLVVRGRTLNKASIAVRWSDRYRAARRGRARTRVEFIRAG